MAATSKLKGLRGRMPTFSTKILGLIVIGAVLLGGVGAFSKDRIATWFTPGDTINAEFSRDYKLVPYKDVVKLAGVRVGEVTGVSKSDRGTTIVSMHVDSGVAQKLGDAPSAAIRPTLVVGGIYDVALTSGGLGNEFPSGGTIPLQRTSVPVELDRVLSTLDRPAQRGLQTSIKQTEGTLAQGGQPSLQQLLHVAPGTFAPAGAVLSAANGTRPGTDIPQIVVGLERTAAVLNRRDGQLGSILDSLDKTTGALAAASRPLADTINKAPATLRTTRAGLADLQGTLDRLQDTAPAFEPSAKALTPVLDDLDPVLARTRPVVSDLNTLLKGTRPLVKQLDPTAGQVTQVLDDVKGPVLDRVNGPIMDTFNNPWHGTGIYNGGGDDHKFYQEVAYLTSVGAGVFQYKDNNGGESRLMAGVGLNTPVGGTKNFSLYQWLVGLGAVPPPAGSQALAPPQRHDVPLPLVGPAANAPTAAAPQSSGIPSLGLTGRPSR
jgi:phospholipid/cholesterol/gamma-HCH transport system substrate-binding protein